MHRSPRTRALVLLATLAALTTLMTFEATRASSMAVAASTAAVGMNDDDEFVPSTVEVHVGDTVLWKNGSTMAHTVTADPSRAKDPKHVVLPEGAATFDSGKLPPGATFSYTFTVAGKYTYVCIPHERQGMIGHVVVRK
jgi:plastocyanin